MGQGYTGTKKEILEYIAQETEKADFTHFDRFVTTAVCENLNVSRNLASQYLNEGFKEGMLIKISTRPVYFFDKKTVLSRYNLESIFEEFGDLEEFCEYIKTHRRNKRNFEKAAGCNLSLKAAVDKCRMAVDYPPNGLPLYIEGRRGTGKSFFAWLSYCYAVDMKIVSEKAEFRKTDCSVYQLREWDTERIKDDINKKLKQSVSGDFLVFENFDRLSEEAQIYLLQLADESQTKGEKNGGGGYGRFILTASEEKEESRFYLHKLISVRVSLPELSERSMIEKEMLIVLFLEREEKRLKRKLRLSEQSYRILLRHPFQKNVGELEECITSMCARAFSVQKESDTIDIKLMMLPREILRGVKPELSRGTLKEKFLGIDEIRDSSDFYREERLGSQIIDKFSLYLANQTDYADFLGECNRLLDEYGEYILFRRAVENEKIRLVEQVLLHIFEYIRDVYHIDVPNSFVPVFSRLTYYSGILRELMQDWNRIHSEEMKQLCEVLQRESKSETLVAREILDLIRQNLEISLSDIEFVVLTILLENIKSAHDALPVQASIICHGYATASSIADVCNKVLKKHVFNAIDMPYDMSVTEIGKQLRSILQYSENRDVLLLVDLGSLENIEYLIGDVSNINFGIINNVSTNLALEIGSSILNGDDIRTILEQASENVKTSYRFMERSGKEDILIFVSESGGDVAARVGELFLNSLPRTLDLAVKCCDYDTFTDLCKTGELDRYNVLFAAATMPVQNENFPVIPIEDIITFNSFSKMRECFNGYLTSDEFEMFRKNLLNVFSLQNVVEALTILNADKVLTQVDAMLDELQILMKRKFMEKTIVGLNIHICCLIERLVKKEEISTHLALDRFEEEHEDFVKMVRKSFSQIEKQYNIELVLSEIAYIYDYIQFEGKKDVLEEEDF